MNNIISYFPVLLLALSLISPNCKAKAQIDTIEVFLEDTGYYYYKGPLELIGYIDSLKLRNKNSNLGSVIFYFNSFGGCQYFFKDSLADGYYKIYDLSKKKNKKDKNAYLVAEGLFINRLRQGIFKYRDVGGNILKVVPFENGIVQGKVFEYFHQRVEYIVEYNRGIIDGFYFHRDRHTHSITINYYRKGELVDYEISIFKQTTMKAPHQAITKFEYNPIGELLESTDPENNVTIYTYDMLGQLTERDHPDAGVTSYTYDRSGNLRSIQTAELGQNNDSIYYSYHYNYLSQITYPEHPEKMCIMITVRRQVN